MNTKKRPTIEDSCYFQIPSVPLPKEANPESAESFRTLSVGELPFFCPDGMMTAGGGDGLGQGRAEPIEIQGGLERAYP